MNSNTYYSVPSPGVEEVVSPAVNLQATARACCAACHDDSRCSAFQWCPLEGGCGVGASQDAFPFQGCQLIDLSVFLKQSVNTGSIKQAGPDVPFTSGACALQQALACDAVLPLLRAALPPAFGQRPAGRCVQLLGAAPAVPAGGRSGGAAAPPSGAGAAVARPQLPRPRVPTASTTRRRRGAADRGCRRPASRCA